MAYNAQERLLGLRQERAGEIGQTTERVRKTLIGDALDAYYSWIIAAFAPWATVSVREPKGKEKPPPPRVAEVAKDSLRADNRTTSILTDAANSATQIIETKGSILAGSIAGTDAEVRQQVGLRIREWRKEWKLCVVMAILLEVMKGRSFDEGKKELFPFVGFQCT